MCSMCAVSLFLTQSFEDNKEKDMFYVLIKYTVESVLLSFLQEMKSKFKLKLVYIISGCVPNFEN